MPLPEEYLRKTPEQKKASLYAAIAEYMKHPPENRKQKAREKLIEELADSPEVSKARLTPQEGADLAADRGRQAIKDRIDAMARGEKVREV